jgi:peptide/nickel transport system substrate-binding protein
MDPKKRDSSPKLTRRKLLKVTGAAGAGAFLAACAPTTGGGPTTSQAPAVIIPPETLRIVQGADAVKIAPTGPGSLITTFTTTSNIYEGLVHFKRPPGYPDFEPVLAERWEQVSPTQMRFFLRQGVKFHNGADFDADSVVFTVEDLRKSQSASRIEPIDRVVPVNKHTVDIFTKQPWFLMLMQFNSSFIVQDRAWTTRPEFSYDQGMGTGPYKLVDWVKGDRIVMERNENWWGGASKLPYKRLEWRVIPETSTRVSALLAGEVDLVREIQPQDVARINAKADLTAKTVQANGVCYVRMRDDGIYANKDFRQALNYALDREAIIQGAMGGFGARTNGNRDPRMFGVDPNLGDYPYDVDKAKQLIAKSGYSGQTIVVESSKGVTFKDAEIAQAMGGFFEKAGLKVDVRILEQGAYNAKRTTVPTDGMILQASGNITPDFENIMNDLTATGTPIERRWKHPRALEIRSLLQKTVDPTERTKLAREGAALLKDEAFVILVATFVDGYGQKKFINWEPRPDQNIWVREMGYKP